MFAITADQVGSRTDVDRATDMVTELEHRFNDDLVLPVDQTSGDELQMLTQSAATAFDAVLHLGRNGRWSIGLGVGDVRMPLADAVRKSTGAAFIAARDAVVAAKRADARFALRAANDRPHSRRHARELEPLIRMVLLARARRSALGWEAIDLVQHGGSQKDAATRLGISGAAMSQRLKAAMWPVIEDSRIPIVRLLHELDAAASDSRSD